MIKRLKLLFATVVVLFAPAVFALGLGELDLQSALNQEFKAEIKLTNLRGLQIDEVLPNLASQVDFDRVGVERNYILTNLRFKVSQVNGGDLVIRVSSNKPIVEPFLNFIVEVLWPNGRILREYTVLLDPPIFGDAGVEAIVATETESRSTPEPRQTKKESNSTRTPTSPISVSQSQVVSQEATEVLTEVSSSVEVSPEQTSSSPASQEGMVDDDEYGMTGAGDTLWTIALKVRPNSSVSVQQTMLALQRANPDAFINNNINLLKAGHVLRIPDVREIREGTIASAVQEVRIQNAEFDAYKNGSLAQLDATRRQTDARTGDRSGDNGELKLLASNQSSGNRAGEGSDARAQELEDNLAVAEEDLDRARRANTEMNVRLDDLQGQLETLNEILTLKDDQLAALRAEIQKMQAATPASAPTPVATSPEDSSGLMSTIVAVLGAIVAFLIAVSGLIFMRRRQQAKALDDEFEEDLLEENVDSDEEDQASEPESDEIEEAVEEEDVTQETNDVISEVEIYIAYGRFPQAITFLQNAIEAEPRRSDIQLKLLEVYVQTEDSTAFNLQFEQLRMLGEEDANEAAQALQVKIPGAAEDAAASMDATIISSEPIIAIDQPEDDEDDFSFDLDDLGSETEDEDLNLTDDLDIDDVELDLDLDLDEEEISLDLDDDDELTLDLDGDDEISLDLDDDDELTLDLDGDDEISLDLDDDDELTLDLDGDDEISLDLDDDDELTLDLDGDDEISLDLDDDDELTLDLDGDDEISLDLDDDDELTLDLDGDDEISLDLDDDDELTLDLDGEDEISLDLDDDDKITLDLEGEDEISLDLDDDELTLDLEGDDEISLNLDDDELTLDLEGEDELSLDLDDDDEISLDLDDDEGNKLDLARAYIDMGDSDGARSVLKDVLSGGTEAEILEANELLEKID